MNCSRFSFRFPSARRWGLALMLGIASAVAPHAGRAQVVTPTPYQSPLFHAGGAPADAADGTGLLPLYSQLQGTPTGLFPAGASGVPTQIPSFLLGAYDPTQPPSTIGKYYPDHFADGSIYSWSAPFVFIPQSASTVTVDDSFGAPTAGPPPTSGFTVSPTAGGFVPITGAPGTSGDLPAATATGGEYYRLPPKISGTAAWTLTAAAAGSYSLYFHIPDNIADSAGAIEARSNLVQYVVKTSGAFAQTQTATVSQTEANSAQFLAGPFQLAQYDTVTVTLQRDATHNQATTADYLVADSMTLQASIGDVQSTPTAINASAFPADFAGANLKYWGIYVAPSASGAQTTGSTTAGGGNAPPDTTGGAAPGATKILHYGFGNTTSTQPDGTPVDANHRIRQLVFFGRQEPSTGSAVRVDDSSGTPSFTTPTGTWNRVTYAAGPPVVNPGAASATNLEYLVTGAANGGSNATAQWTLPAPGNGAYFLSVHLPGLNTGEKRISDAAYTVTVTRAGTVISTTTTTLSQATQFGDILLPSGSLPLLAGDVVTVTLGNGTGNTGATGLDVVADSITLTSGTGHGAIYCVDGFNGAVVWRYETAASAAGASAPVFSSPAVVKINVMTSPGDPSANPVVPPTYENKLVVIVGDNNGLVYCLDAIGHGDGTSNSQAVDPNTGQPITLPQPGYGTLGASPINPAGRPVPVDAATGYAPHVGTTNAYWVYRPDATMPKYVAGDGKTGTAGTVKAVADRDPLSDLPVPSAFGTASPTVFVDPSVAPAAAGTTYTTPPTNATVYVGNSNGVLYALDALGVLINAGTAAQYAASGDTFNASQDIRRARNVFPQVATDAVAPTCQPRWWFTLRGGNAALATSASAADFESAPALHITAVSNGATPPVIAHTPRVFIGSAHEQESTSNVGRLYALNGLLGPAGNSGRNLLPGTLNYNVAQRPQTSPTDTADWSFPDAYGTDTYTTGLSSNKKPRPALGNITGSPVVFTDVNEGTAARKTRVYFAANVGLEVPKGSTGKTPAPRPDAAQTGRVWAVNLDGSVGTTTGTTAVTSTATTTNAWAYPSAWDPNDATKDTSPEPSTPIGAFLHATPSIGVVQFPLVISNGDTTLYGHTDASGSDVKGRSVPMLYVASRGVNDTALYALDIDGKDDSTAATTPGGAGADKLIYRQISPDGAIYQSSPALVTNPSASGGNGGAVFVTAGNTLYDFSATPISNPIPTEAFPLVRENRAFTGFGPLSSPTLSAADTTDLPVTTTTATNPTAFAYLTNAVDWVYCGDTSTGLCHGITPYDTTYAGQTNLGGILPADFGGVSTIDLSSALRSYLVSDANAGSTKYTDRLDNGSTALPVYEWGQNVYIRFANVVPPGRVPANYVHDQGNTAAASPANLVKYYGDGGPVEFDLSDTTSGDPADHATVPAVLVTALAAKTLPADGFIARTDTDTDNNLIDGEAPPTQWIAAYTYAIGDGSARRNTPGGQRQVINARQIVHVFTYDGTAFTDTGATVTLAASTTNGGPKSVLDPATGKYTFGPNPIQNSIQPVEQPKFGILNPIGLRAGGLPLSLNNTPVTNAAEIGDEVGPFRGVASLLDSSDTYALEALANGNDIPVAAPTSTTGGGKKGGGGIGNPTQRLASAVAAPTTTHHTVVTATGLIPHNGGGDNSDFTAAATLPTGTLGNTDPRGLSAPPPGLSATNFGSPDQPYAADVFDRSALGLVGKSLSLKMYTPNGAGGGLFWNDNTQNTTGHDSVVNFLPWETPPATYRVGQANTSPDYPDIASQNVTATLYPRGGGGGDLGSDGVMPTVATPGATLQRRTVYASPLQVHVSVPHHQPANQQLYDKTAAGGGYSAVGEISPSGIVSASDTVFPMGYVTTKRIYAANISGRFQDGTAYRDIRVYTGVPIDMSTSIANPTTDIGKVPGAFGIQVSQYPGYKDTAANIGFTPYNATFAQNYQPVTVNNNGNVNLLNVHFDQLYAVQGPNNTSVSTPLSLMASALDPLSSISAYDAASVTGPRSDTFNNVSELPFLVRSSLDPDLAAAYGINPGIATDATLKAFYPSATFHKPRVGSDTPTVLTVPDVPSVNTAGAPFSLYLTADKPVIVEGEVRAVDNNPKSPTYNKVLLATAPPYVSVGIPFGTPVGTYSQTLRLFEGRDVSGYTTYNAGSGSYNPLYPPQYGGSIGGLAAPTSAPGSILYPGLQPLSTTGTVVKATVLEDRMTDGYTAGSLPHVDAGPAVPASVSGTTAVPAQSTPDFAPAAFRDASSGNLSLYWTSRRSGSYRIQQANVPFNNQNTPGYFSPSDPKNDWWSSGLAPGLVTTGTNSGLTVTPEGSEAFAVNVATPPYANTLYCYPVTASTGALGTAQRVTSDPSQVKYGVKGVFTGAAFGNADPNLWAFWTASTRGRTAIYYNSHTAGAAGDWTQTTGLLPIPAGLTAVADPASVLLNAPVVGTNGTATLQSTLEVTYSGTGPDGGVNLYAGRYQPDAKTATKLDPVPFPQVTEILAAQPGGWFQARDVAWSRTSALNVYAQSTVGNVTSTTPLLYDAMGKPLFSRAVFDRASGLLVLTGVPVPLIGAANGAPQSTTNTLYVDAATGRIRFSPALLTASATPNQNFIGLRATFTPLVRRITVDTRADTGVTTFLDTAQKSNDGPGLNNVEADRRWYFWRKSAVSTDTHSATIYDKTQRLTVYLPTPIAVGGTPAKPTVTVMIGTTDISAFVDVDYSRGRIYFPINAGGMYTEGQPATVTYTDATGTSKTFTDNVYWQDEIRAGDLTATPNGSADGIAHSVDYAVPIDTVVNENNVAAFLDPQASATVEHKVWLFWNSTRNGTADIYTETINPRFAP
jgi:hypothetical protein